MAYILALFFTHIFYQIHKQCKQKSQSNLVTDKPKLVQYKEQTIEM